MWVWLEQLLQDLGYGLRSMRRAPGFTIAAVVTLSLGIGANTAIFSLVNAILLRQLPFKNPEQLVAVDSKRTDPGKHPFTIPDFIDYRDQNQTLDQRARSVFAWHLARSRETSSAWWSATGCCLQ